MILFCSCSYNNIVNKELLVGLIAYVSASGEEYRVVDDLCRISVEEKELLREMEGATVVACYSRAVEGLFKFAGSHPGKILNIRDLSIYNCSGKELTDELLKKLGIEKPLEKKDDIVLPDASGNWVPWFPVIDYKRCIYCKKCLDYCLFGVYTHENGRVKVLNPDHCKNNCPACARVCPEKAIIFPKYPRSFINGGLKEEEPAVDMDELVRKRDLYKQLQARNQNRNKLV